MGSGIRWGKYQQKHSPEGLRCVQLERGPTGAQGAWHDIALKARDRAEAALPITVELPRALLAQPARSWEECPTHSRPEVSGLGAQLRTPRKAQQSAQQPPQSCRGVGAPHSSSSLAST